MPTRIIAIYKKISAPAAGEEGEDYATLIHHTISAGKGRRRPQQLLLPPRRIILMLLQHRQPPLSQLQLLTILHWPQMWKLQLQRGSVNYQLVVRMMFCKKNLLLGSNTDIRALLKDAQVYLKREECASGMGQRFLISYAAVKGAKYKLELGGMLGAWDEETHKEEALQ